MKKAKEVYRGEEKRKYIRVSIPFTFIHKKENEDWQEASTTKDISLGGLRFIASKLLSNASLELEIWIPTSIGSHIKLKAKVVWQKKKKKGIFSKEYETGLSFVETEKDRKDLGFFLEKSLEKRFLLNEKI